MAANEGSRKGRTGQFHRNLGGRCTAQARKPQRDEADGQRRIRQAVGRNAGCVDVLRGGRSKSVPSQREHAGCGAQDGDSSGSHLAPVQEERDAGRCRGQRLGHDYQGRGTGHAQHTRSHAQISRLKPHRDASGAWQNQRRPRRAARSHQRQRSRGRRPRRGWPR